MSHSDAEIRDALLAVVVEFEDGGAGHLQAPGILSEAAKRLSISRDSSDELALLDIWQVLFVEGTLAWGHDIVNSGPPFLHLTRIGRAALGLPKHPA